MRSDEFKSMLQWAFRVGVDYGREGQPVPADEAASAAQRQADWRRCDEWVNEMMMKLVRDGKAEV